ncbi:MAG: DUF4843 domain-containing protein [Duncaniella sp.]|nr:DUF4843 domain-containing protein [Duncaniella sp.]
MKTIRISILSFAAALAVTACSTEEVDRFDPSFEALNIGFGSADNLTQKATYNYSETANERAVKFYARVSGTPADYDREFTLEAVEGNLTEAAGSYRSETYVIPAGKVSGEYNIYFDPSKLSSPAAFTTEDGELVFRVVPGGSFRAGALNQNELRFTLKNRLAKPEEWDEPSYGYLALSRYFGTYSTEKFQFMIENGCPINFRVSYSQSAPTTMEGDVTIMSDGYASYLRQVYYIALLEYNETHDTPLCDKVGNPISF